MHHFCIFINTIENLLLTSRKKINVIKESKPCWLLYSRFCSLFFRLIGMSVLTSFPFPFCGQKSTYLSFHLQGTSSMKPLLTHLPPVNLNTPFWWPHCTLKASTMVITIFIALIYL